MAGKEGGCGERRGWQEEKGIGGKRRGWWGENGGGGE